MILAEQLVLLALEPETGKFARGLDRERLRLGAAASIVAEMALHKRLARAPEGMALSDAMPDFHPLLSEATALLARVGRSFGADEAIARVASGISGLLDRLLHSLNARDILHDQREAFFFHRYPVRSMQSLREVFAHVHAVESGNHPQPTHIALAAVADACGVIDVRLTPEERFRVRRHLDPDAQGSCVRNAPEDVQLVLDIAKALAESL
ncbi:MAG TPA: GPP34 family phosphoprotein [Xanthomonadales bacterium]|nr:GPP34 family phosphoprotein [Xanthomonadales bacterium]